MKKIIFTVFIVSCLFCGIASAEICIANRCTDATSVGSISVSSVNGSWNCSGPGCSSFEQQQVRPRIRLLSQSRYISPEMRKRILIDPRFEGSILREELTRVKLSPQKKFKNMRIMGNPIHFRGKLKPSKGTSQLKITGAFK